MTLEALNAALQQTLPMGHLEIVPVPGCGRVRLALINRDFPTGPLPGDVMRAVLANPAYWSLCWGSGLALARSGRCGPWTEAGTVDPGP